MFPFRAVNILTSLAVLVLAALVARDLVELRIMPREDEMPGGAVLVKKASKADWPVEAYKTIAEAGAFGKSEFRLLPVRAGSSAAPLGAALPLELLGTATGAGGFAVFMNTATKKQGLFEYGQDVFGYGVLARVEQGRAFLSAGEKELVFIVPSLDKKGAGPQMARRPWDGPVKAAPAETKMIDARAFRAGLERPDRLMSDVMFSLSSREGGIAGFRVSEIRQGSVFSVLGLNDGDIVAKVNGYSVDSPEKAAQVFAGLKGETAINLEIIRQGKPLVLKYSIR